MGKEGRGTAGGREEGVAGVARVEGVGEGME